MVPDAKTSPKGYVLFRYTIGLRPQSQTQKLELVITFLHLLSSGSETVDKDLPMDRILSITNAL